jgi:outer membrane protein assembly factor BamB
LNGSYLVAMNLNTGKRVWMNTHLTADVPAATAGPGTPTPTLASFQGGMLTTASGLLVTGNGNSLSAFDSKTGALVWTSPPLKAGVVSPPSTYMVNGKQYIAVEVGNGGLLGGPFGTPVPGQVATVYVYSLP